MGVGFNQTEASPKSASNNKQAPGLHTFHNTPILIYCMLINVFLVLNIHEIFAAVPHIYHLSKSKSILIIIIFGSKKKKPQISLQNKVLNEYSICIDKRFKKKGTILDDEFSQFGLNLSHNIKHIAD